ncbi:MAG: PASTA domain-containing protein [Oligoflexus sp.]
MCREKMKICLILLALFSLSCTKIVIKVAKKDRSAANNQESITASSDDANREPRIYDFEYYLLNLDELRNISGEELYARLQDNWRHIFRREFRNFRQAVMDTAQRQHSYQDGLMGNLEGEECRILEHADFKSFDGQQFLEILLEASFLANVDIQQAKKLNPGLINQLDLIVHIVLFELGMQADGESHVHIDGAHTTMESSIVWKIDPERPDPEEMTELDDYAIRFKFQRRFLRSQPEAFTLQVEFARGLFENRDIVPEYRMELEHRWVNRDNLGSALEMVLRIWHGDELNYSRLIALEQSAPFSQVYLFRDILRYELANEEERRAVVDFAELKKCALSQVQMIVPGVIGMQPDDAEEILRTLQLKIGTVEDTTAGSPEVVVIRQDPPPGSKVPIGSEVDMVLGLWTDLDIPMAEEPGEEQVDAGVEDLPVQEEAD